MRKSLLTAALAVAAFSAYAEDPTYNFFDPADCDADGWLWLDTPEKIAKYCGEGKKIQLMPGLYEVDSEEFPGEMEYPATTASADIKGYNTEGIEGGEGSKTGGIVMYQADGHGLFGTPGGGILVQMPDCAVFDVYLSQRLPDAYTYILGARGYKDSLSTIFDYIWNEDESGWDDSIEYGPVKGITYAGYDMNIQNIEYDLSWGDGTDILKIYGPKGEPRTAGFYNFSLCPMIIQGIRIFTFTDVNSGESSVEGIVAGADLRIEGKVVTASAPVEIEVYNAAGAKVAGAYGTSLDCSALKGIYIVKAGAKSLKALF